MLAESSSSPMAKLEGVLAAWELEIAQSCRRILSEEERWLSTVPVHEVVPRFGKVPSIWEER